MPIEFTCVTCGRLLRTPDQSAGKKARCPACQTLVDVPSPPSAAAPAAPSPYAGESSPFAGAFGSPAPPPAPPANPFADAGGPTSPFTSPDLGPVNPYAAPSATSNDLLMAARDGGPELRPTTVDFGELFNRIWSIFTANLGTCILAGLVMFGALIAMQVVAQIGAFAAQATGELSVVLTFQIVNTLFGVLIQSWVNLGLLYFALRLSKGLPATVGDMFSIGRYYLRGLGIMFVSYLIYAGILLIGLLPAAGTFFALGGWPVVKNDPTIVMLVGLGGFLLALAGFLWIFLRLFLALPFLLDRDAGVLESLQSSDVFMRGNKLVVFLMFLVASMVGGMAALCTCYLGLMAVYPYMAILVAVVYLGATGQLAPQPRSMAN